MRRRSPFAGRTGALDASRHAGEKHGVHGRSDARGEPGDGQTPDGRAGIPKGSPDGPVLRCGVPGAQGTRPRGTIRSFWGERTLLAIVDLAAHAVLPAHHHPAEQAGPVLTGELELSIAGKTCRLKPGGVEHSARTRDVPAVLSEVFSPISARTTSIDRPHAAVVRRRGRTHTTLFDSERVRLLGRLWRRDG